MNTKTTLLITTALILLLSAGAFIRQHMSNVETPKYSVLKKDNDIEIREYPTLLVAQTQKPGERDVAISEGFRTLADYIFGNNQASKNTAGESPSEKIAMTAPVIQQKRDNEWVILFVMPSKFNESNIPQPMNKEVAIQTRSKTKYIVIQFSGTTSKSNLDNNLNKLNEFIESNKIKTKGAPIFAFYNPPWTLPFLRRNEIWFEIE